METAQRVSPVALRAVVGTKADLQDNREVTIEQALVCDSERGCVAVCIVSLDGMWRESPQEFCRKHSGSASPIPYYETSTKFPDSILLAFQEIMARPLINDYVVSSSELWATPLLDPSLFLPQIKTTTEQEQKIFVHEVCCGRGWSVTSHDTPPR